MVVFHVSTFILQLQMRLHPGFYVKAEPLVFSGSQTKRKRKKAGQVNSRNSMGSTDLSLQLTLKWT